MMLRCCKDNPSQSVSLLVKPVTGRKTTMSSATAADPATLAFSMKDLHDRAREYFANPRHMADFLAQRLPADVCEALVLDNLKLLEESFVDAKTREAFSDLVFSCTTREGKTAYVYALFEREEQPEPLCALQALWLMTNLWSRMPTITGPEEEELLPFVLPVAFKQGKGADGIESLRDFFGQEDPLPGSFMACIPNLNLTTFRLENIIRELPKGE